ncbi:Putative peptidoglycan binding domain-containing protein [Pseudonocardia thermophila]|uniref:Putative peptidoglycan binding domain-containing protein n=1 Tax=Pseudonocardia thermophila TaxID=1848 RepID=A0A1M6UZI1_PSETH|nr:peptidoglycan-binding domain-containing protein [Pseudonocardia thermophila]SHK74515.1 Putative peptidoglycan binding domain-containing protein [Pseudonocardia thermophila]
MITTTPAPAAPVAQKNGRGRGIALAAAGLLAGAGIATGLVIGLGGTSEQAVPAPSGAVVIDGGSAHGGSAHHHVTPPVKPSAAIEKLQNELAQLNYYQGPINGIMNAQTRQAITYLQRDAGLPQTGEMNAATQAALANFLAHGNNQMNGMNN